ncbi:STAS domain-containing protein [Stenotrophomonas sp. MMGLT7]|uniref:STAS domain-containing protein n=1 Tax=Stenotrophomonas sp. MMGLT7 TaxID=2901227 RepID=UPI001E41BF12|nr:STAS domain-containing protein [Stenotrophomonas sp. MMGLT7]MCD7097086.1 STAS domain-containing protein [Stenotrophomonas sp. MMGLT7]
MSTVTLGEDLGIETCSDLKLKLAPLLAEDGELVLDAGEVRRIHTASVQVLCAFVRTRREAGRTVEIEPCNDIFRDAARLLGVCDVLGLPASNDNLKTVENAA